jgi:fumarate reductase subunit D
MTLPFTLIIMVGLSFWAAAYRYHHGVGQAD